MHIHASPHGGTIGRWAAHPRIAKTKGQAPIIHPGKNASMSDNTDAVLRSTRGRIGILTVNNPPVNALAAAVRDGI